MRPSHPSLEPKQPFQSDFCAWCDRLAPYPTAVSSSSESLPTWGARGPGFRAKNGGHGREKSHILFARSGGIRCASGLLL
eukprot:12911819-Prorocentrum_lima.AAC.1